MTPAELVAELYETRIDLELSVCELERRTGINDTTINGWELGKRAPRLDQFVAVADALGLEVIVQPKRGESR